MPISTPKEIHLCAQLQKQANDISDLVDKIQSLLHLAIAQRQSSQEILVRLDKQEQELNSIKAIVIDPQLAMATLEQELKLMNAIINDQQSAMTKQDEMLKSIQSIVIRHQSVIAQWLDKAESIKADIVAPTSIVKKQESHLLSFWTLATEIKEVVDQQGHELATKLQDLEFSCLENKRAGLIRSDEITSEVFETQCILREWRSIRTQRRTFDLVKKLREPAKALTTKQTASKSDKQTTEPEAIAAKQLADDFSVRILRIFLGHVEENHAKGKIQKECFTSGNMWYKAKDGDILLRFYPAEETNRIIGNGQRRM